MRFTNEYPYRRMVAEQVASYNCRGERSDRGATSNNEYASMSKGQLLHLIDALTFVKGELELYLDAYPDCQKALADYRDNLTMLMAATNEYERRFAPLWASGGAMGNRWSWVNTPWPWHNDRTEDK